MLSKEIKQLLELSGGKIIVSEGDLEKSYLIMRLEDYLKERILTTEKEDKFVLEDVNAQVETLRQKQMLEKLTDWEVEDLMREEKIETEASYEKISN